MTLFCYPKMADNDGGLIGYFMNEERKHRSRVQRRRGIKLDYVNYQEV